MTGAEIPRPPVHRIALVQFTFLVLLCVVLAAFDKVSAYSAFCGGLVAIIPQAWFAHVAFRKRGAGGAIAAAQAGYAGEAGKFLLSAAGFALVFALVRPIVAPAVFAAFVVMLAVQVAGSRVLLTRGQ